MSKLGRPRERLAGILNAAFAEGLLSEQTHSYRLGVLFGAGLIDQQRLIGDLTLRDGSRTRAAEPRKAWRAAIESLRAWRGSDQSTVPLLLTLDGVHVDRLLVGRDPSCDLVVTHPSVSRGHAQLTYRDGRWMVQDLASTNGTSVNGARVVRAALQAGDVLALGGQLIAVD